MCKMETKQELRRKFKACGATLTNEYRDFADCAIRAFVQYSEVWQRAESVFVYISMWAEPDTRALIEAALAEGKRVYVPLCCPDRTMKAVRITSLAELRPGTLNIPEPPAENEAAQPGMLDLAVVPCVTACPAMCLCYGQMLADALPMDEHDVWMDYIATEAGVTVSERGSSGSRS